MTNKNSNEIELTDAELAAKIKEGHKPSENVLIDRHYKVLGSYNRDLFRFLPEAEDATQDVCIIAIIKLRDGTYLEDGKYLNWLYSIARVNAMGKRKKKLFFVLFDDETMDIIDITDEAKLLKAARWVWIDAQVLLMTVRRQQIFNDHIYDGQKFKDIGESFGKTGGYASSEFSKIVKLLGLAEALNKIS
jgi:RNA polymerase sigma-70 factor (ECF subfamily)